MTSFETGVKNSMHQPPTDEEIKTRHESEVKENETKAAKFVEAEKTKPEEPAPEIEEVRQYLIKQITSMYKNGTAEQKSQTKEILNGIKLVDADSATLTKIKTIFN
jgi:hypothetical protein